MVYQLKLVRRLTLLIVWIPLSLPAFAEMSSDIQEELQRNALSLSPITVTWEKRTSSELPLQDWLSKVNYKPYNIDVFLPAKTKYCWQRGMTYQQQWLKKVNLISVMDLSDEKNPKLKPNVILADLPVSDEDSEVACNLEDVFLGMGREANKSTASQPSLTIDSLTDPKIFENDAILFNPEYFFAAGFKMPSRFDALQDGAKSRVKDILDNGGVVTGVNRSVLIKGSICVLVELSEADRKHRFYLDPEKGYAVCRSEELSSAGEIRIVIENSNFKKLQRSEVWLPAVCEIDYFGWPSVPDLITSTPLTHEALVVSELDDSSIPIELFSLHYTEPGTLISDSTLPQAKDTLESKVNYEVPADIRDLDAVIKRSVDGKPFVPAAIREMGRGLMRWIVVANCMLVIGVILLYALSKRRQNGRQ